MIVFSVIKEPFGWAVCAGDCMTTTFRTRDCAVREAHCLANAIRSHGQDTEVVVLDEDEDEAVATRVRSAEPMARPPISMRG
jgi:hypothetical protein